MSKNTNHSMPVNIIVAHALEARALISMLSLTRRNTGSAYVQYNNASQVHLLVCGIGKEAIAGAVRYLGELQADTRTGVRAWLNIGIAGHRDAPLGSAWLGNKITDSNLGSNAYPPQLIEGVRSGAVVTVDAPEIHYPLDAAYEMEASAFYAEATKYSTAELVQVYKVISDNLENPIAAMDTKSVPGLIAAQKTELILVLEGLANLVEQYNLCQRLPESYHEVCLRIHLTVNQQLQLRRLCQRYQALGLEDELASVIGSQDWGAKKLLKRLVDQIDSIPET